jgi:FkbM family methyltransferase
MTKQKSFTTILAIVVIFFIALFVQNQLNYKKLKRLVSTTQSVTTNNGISSVEFQDGTGLVVNSAKKFSMFYDAKDGFVSQVIRSSGYYYQPEIASALKDIVHEGDTVVHFGGHIGSFEGLLAELVTKSGKVFTFEANPISFRVLKKNVMLHDHNNIIKIYQKGVWDEADSKNICFSYENTGGASIHDATTNGTCFPVELVKADDILENEINKIDVLFMDIEGAEYKAMNGLAKILANSPDAIILMEVSANKKESDIELRDFFTKRFNSTDHIYQIRGDFGITKYKEIHSLEEFMTLPHSDIVIIPDAKNPEKLLEFIGH